MKKIKQYWDMLLFHSSCALRAEFKRYYLHFVWWFLDPLFTLGVLYLVFGVFLNNRQPNYAIFILTGLVLWQWFGKTVPNAAGSIHGSRRMFQHFRVHPIHFPLCTFLQNLGKYLPVLAVFIVVTALFGPYPPSVLWLNIIPIMLVEALCVIGCSICVAAIIPFLPDLAVLVPIIVQALFFASGIFYDVDRLVPLKYRAVIYLNPNAVCIKSLRDVFIQNTSPDWALLGRAALISLALTMFGVLLVNRCRKVYPRLIAQ